MNPKVKLLAEQAGFMFWENEPWRPDNVIIDWSSNYDNELQEFVKLIVQECITVMQEQERIPEGFLYPKPAHVHALALKDRFGAIS